MDGTTTCSTTCPDNYYEEDSTNTCDSCNAGCLTCTGTGTSNCQSCADDNYLLDGTTICSTSCPNGFYAEDSSNTCEACDEECATCTDSGNTDC